LSQVASLQGRVAELEAQIARLHLS
jgi:hypothetical protein